MAELGIPSTASAGDIKHLFRRFLLTSHPDKGGDDASFAEHFKKWQMFL